MNDEQLQAIKARANAATPGPWECHNDDFVVVLHDGVWHTISIPDTSPNAAFIAAARADVPALVAEVERLRAELAAVPVAEIGRMVDDSLTTRDIAVIDAWIHGDKPDGAE